MAGHRRAKATPSFGRLCPAMTRERERERERDCDLLAASSGGTKAPKKTQEQPTRLRGRNHVDFTAGARRGGAIRWAGRAGAAADARPDPSRPPVSDLGAVRSAGADLGLR